MIEEEATIQTCIHLYIHFYIYTYGEARATDIHADNVTFKCCLLLRGMRERVARFLV